MKTSIIIAICLLVFMAFTPFETDKPCPHCEHIAKYEERSETDPLQPKPYIHSDSLFEIQPVITNVDMDKKYQYLHEFRLTYKDDHFCSRISRVTFYLENDSVALWNIRPGISCRIDMWFRYNDKDMDLLSKYPIKEVKILNATTRNEFCYVMEDPYYFVRIYDKMKSKPKLKK